MFELPDEPYPGEDKVIDAAEKGCTDKADPLLTDEAYNDLDPSFIYPDSYTWRGDRSVLCLVEAPSGTTTARPSSSATRSLRQMHGSASRCVSGAIRPSSGVG